MSKQTGFSSAVIVAGGSGSRMGRPKQMLPLGGKPVLVRTVEAFLQTPEIKEIVVVTPSENRAELQKRFPGIVFADPGKTRLLSVKNGFLKTSAASQLVAVHDGARPLVEPAHISACLQAARQYGAAVLAVPVKDTVKVCEGGFVQNTLDRAVLWAAQTPQCYRRPVLAEALEKFGQEEGATDESQLVEKLGIKVRVVPSSYKNNKITTPEDLIFAEALLENSVIYRTGFGFDLHRLEPGRKLFIGGAEIPHTKGFLGHSDGDLVLHALCDAVLGALCAGEIGILFPPTDESIKGISSVKIVKKVLEIVRSHHAQIEHIDATIITQEPKIKPHYETVRKSLAEVFEMPLENVSFKSKSHEHVGEIGRGEAAMCHAVATLKIQK
ncbi:2-C-methyl-D-erythritol 4-phosphate cytidylyltransferase [Candidatus Avelusimicrobium fimicolum]|jgi:2-C-methyl-D-erythritol 4-phosphate cytidylyltransferase / 2-C-methyl-D-erythritol 2,4-cyclodiphosphate synthase|uniref:2-C-methyl-D-erythritol 4-phosphate cytidylyltransferase n=1 Tax=Candidatus Avelusimicrobium fimicolum TaxID=3416216 RepID=UPI003D10A027